MDGGPIRVAVIGHTAKLSGGKLAISRLISAMENVSVHVVLAEEGPLVEVLVRAGATVEVLPMDRRARNLRKERIRIGSVPFAAAWATTTYTVRLAETVAATPARPGAHEYSEGCHLRRRSRHVQRAFPVFGT